MTDGGPEETEDDAEEKRDDSQEKLEPVEIEFPTKIDSELVQRAFVALKKENAELKSKYATFQSPNSNNKGI